ncbi:MAG: DUF6446 family protein [Rhodobacteraceae bacterium]|nr:DUF6446 family protein [Paracoccaceae bacterium]
MNGKLVGGSILGAALIAGAGLYYLQVYHFYDPVNPGALEIAAMGSDGAPVELDIADVTAIDASSSPIRFRACFSLGTLPDIDALTPYVRAEPLTAPYWFDCFDAAAIAGALDAGDASALLGQAEIAHGVDRVLAILPDGTGYAWHQFNPDFEE